MIRHMYKEKVQQEWLCTILCACNTNKCRKTNILGDVSRQQTSDSCHDAAREDTSEERKKERKKAARENTRETPDLVMDVDVG